MIRRLTIAARDARYAFVDSWRGELLDSDPPAPPPAPAPDPVDAAAVMYRQMVEAADEFWATLLGGKR